MAFDLGNLLQQYLGGGQPGNTAQVEQHFDEVANNASQSSLGNGVAEALRSDKTPPFGEMVGQLFNNGNPQQRAGMLNQLIAGLSPSILGSLGGALGGGAAAGGLGSILGGLMGGQAGGTPTITAEQASQIDPAQVQQIAERAQAHNPGIIDQMGNFYAAHPTLVKTLGGAALAIVMGKMAHPNAS